MVGIVATNYKFLFFIVYDWYEQVFVLCHLLLWMMDALSEYLIYTMTLWENLISKKRRIKTSTITSKFVTQLCFLSLFPVAKIICWYGTFLRTVTFCLLFEQDRDGSSTYPWSNKRKIKVDLFANNSK